MIYEMNDNSFVNVKTRIERIKQMEDYQRNNFLQKRALIVELVALIGTILFGLPTLKDTLTILRECFLPAGDLIRGNVVQLCAVSIWVLLIGLINSYLYKSYKEYEKKKLWQRVYPLRCSDTYLWKQDWKSLQIKFFY